MNAALDGNLRLREPGLLPAGVERRRVPAGGMLALPVCCGDAVEIVDPQGLQAAHVAGFNHLGESLTAALGVAENAGGERMARCLARAAGGGAESAQRLDAKLCQHGIDLGRARVAELLAGESRPGNAASFVCAADARRRVAARQRGVVRLRGRCAVFNLRAGRGHVGGRVTVTVTVTVTSSAAHRVNRFHPTRGRRSAR